MTHSTTAVHSRLDAAASCATRCTQDPLGSSRPPLPLLGLGSFVRQGLSWATLDLAWVSGAAAITRVTAASVVLSDGQRNSSVGAVQDLPWKHCDSYDR